jgi:hypothetical protein
MRARVELVLRQRGDIDRELPSVAAMSSDAEPSFSRKPSRCEPIELAVPSL